jgi:transcriptional regulator with XRE-family HTH domain
VLFEAREIPCKFVFTRCNAVCIIVLGNVYSLGGAMTVGQEIRRLREKKGWSQAKLGVLAGTGPSGISQIETGRRNPSAATLARIAKALGVEVRDLFPLGQAPLPDMQGYDVLLEERGFPREQIAAWLAQDERDREFIAGRLEKMSKQDFREALLTSPALRRMREYYRKNDPGASKPQSESA